VADPPTSAPSGLGRRVAVASFYAVLQRALLRGIGLFGTVILARLLAPEDFGIVAVAAIVQTFLEILSSTSFQLALVRMPAPSRAHYDTVFTMNLLRGLLLGGVLFGLADLQAALMGEPRVAGVMRLLAVSVVLQGLHSVRMADFQRELRFDRILRFDVAGKLILFAISMPLAFWLRNYWALVLGSPLSQLLVIPLSYYMAPHRPRLGLSAWREFFNFSKWLFLGNLCGLLDGQQINILVGRFAGIAALGLFQVAYQIAALPVSEIAAPLRGPAYAGYARAQGDLAAMRWQFRTTLELMWVIILPLSVGIGLTAHEITRLFLGERWLSLAPIMPLVGLYALCDAIGQFTHGLQIVLNRQARMVLSWFAIVLVRIPLVAWATVAFGLTGAMVAMLATGVVNAILWLRLAGQLIGLRLRDTLLVLWRGAAAAGAMAAIVRQVPPPEASIWPASWFWSAAIVLVIKATAGAAIYAAGLFATWRLQGSPRDSAEAYLLRMGKAGLDRLGTLPS
jgi:lipopolysaccharide exporter